MNYEVKSIIVWYISMETQHAEVEEDNSSPEDTSDSSDSSDDGN